MAVFKFRNVIYNSEAIDVRLLKYLNPNEKEISFLEKKGVDCSEIKPKIKPKKKEIKFEVKPDKVETLKEK